MTLITYNILCLLTCFLVASLLATTLRFAGVALGDHMVASRFNLGAGLAFGECCLYWGCVDPATSSELPVTWMALRVSDDEITGYVVATPGIGLASFQESGSVRRGVQ